MNTSKEELIELVELTSPIKEKPGLLRSIRKEDLTARSDNTYSVTSVCSGTSNEDNIVNIFSVNPKSFSKRPGSSDRRTISEISDDVFLVKPETKPSTSTRKFQNNYKEKISEHLKKVKERAINSSDLAKSRYPIERVRRESEHLDVEIDNIRSKFKDRESNRDKDVFFNFNEEQKEDGNSSEENNDPLIFYALPEKLDFSVHLAEKECFWFPSRFKSVPDNKKMGPTESIHENIPNISSSSKNILEQRFSSIEDRRWFDTEGNLNFLENPFTPVSLRPSNYSVNDPNLTKYTQSSMDMHEELTELVIVKDNILDVYLSHLKFHHHPLFSAEHVFSEKLKVAFQEYKTMKKENILENLKAHLEDLRRESNQHNGSFNLRNEIKNARNKYFKASKKYKEIILTSLELWKHVKKIRAHQKYSNTSVKLLIKKEKTDQAAEAEEYHNMFEQSLEELKKESEHEVINSDDSIEEKSEIKSIRESGDDGASIESTILSKNEDIKKTELKNQLKKTFKSCFKTPGEPNILLALTATNGVTENPDFAKEKSRRNSIFSTKFYLRILCNNIEACKTKFLSLTNEFGLEIEEVFSLQLTDIPKYLIVEVYEQPKSLLKKKLCEIAIDIPVGKRPMQVEKQNFEKNDIVHYKHEGVGSGIDLDLITEDYDLKLINLKNYNLQTCGYLEYGLEWEKDNIIKGGTDTLQAKFQEIDEIIDQNFVIHYDKLRKLIEVENEREDTYVQTMEIFGKSSSCFFRLNTQSVFSFCHISEIEDNIRLKILQLRNDKEIEFDGMLVPNRLKEIPINVFSQYIRRKSDEKKGFNYDETDEFKNQYFYGKKFLQQVHIKIFQLCKNTENNLDYESVVNEKYFIYFQWRPKISKPLPILSKNNNKENLQITKASLYLTVKILSAKNIPNRKKYTFNDDEKPENDVCPFVEVNYKNVFARTTTSKGSNPFWNETLVLPLESIHMDYLNPNSLEGIISVNLFDESNIEITKLNKKCINWLGAVDISLSSICCSDKMSGYFKITIPYVLLDYEAQGEKLQKLQKISTSSITHSHLQMEIFIDPLVPKLNPNMEELPCGDIPYIQDHVLKWNRTFNSSYPHRKFNALVLDINGKTTCVTRFIKPLEPPQINTEEFDVSVEQCCRYVSLIPFTDSNYFYSNIWLSADQLINLMLGSIIDHAIALTGYLTALKLDVWLLLGYGIPHGNTGYVFLPEYSGDTPLPIYYIIDVVFNEKYNLLEEHCPLQRVFCVINSKNVWANIQTTDNITLTRFDFNRNSDWLPLFNNNVAAPTNFVGKKVIYRIKEDTEMLEINLEKRLKRQISKLRLLDRTIWNTGLSSVLTNFLRIFELNCMYNKSHHETLIELNQEISQYMVSGFAINTHFTSFSTLVKKIKRLGIHIQQERDMEFSLAAYIHSYPGRLFSVWIFLVNIRNTD